MTLLGNTDVPSLITGIATITAASIGAWAAVKANNHAKKSAFHAEAADNAVNHRKPGEPRLIEVIDSLYAGQQLQDTRAERLEGKVDRVDERLAQHIADHRNNY